MTRSLTVWWDGVVVGSLALDRHGVMRFAYDGDWVADPARPPVSFSLLPVVATGDGIAVPAPGQPTTHILKPPHPL